MSKWENNEEIKIFQEYLRIPTVHPDVDYEPCIEFLKKQAESLGLPVKVFCPGGPKKPILVMTWIGTQPELPSVVLNSHTDVVPVFPENWTHPPFGAEIDAEGKIYARGAQDMKCVGMQYLAAIRALKKDGVTLKRTIHVVYVPDEEIGGKLGMEKFIPTTDFKFLNVGFSLDEGIAGPTEEYPVFYAERSIWHVHFKISGTTGHGSLLHKNTTGQKLRYIIDKFMDMRAVEEKKLENNPHFTIGDVTTINLTMINGGVQDNVVPPLIDVGFDIRIALDLDHKVLDAKFEQWIKEAGGGIEIEFTQKEALVEATKIDASNPYWIAFKSVIDELGLKIKTQVFPGGTDSRYIRKAGVPAIGFSPMNHTPVLLHDNDEFIKADIYLNGIEIYKKLIPRIANA
ncbi:ACY1.2 family protein [Megaselia abdita]